MRGPVLLHLHTGQRAKIPKSSVKYGYLATLPVGPTWSSAFGKNLQQYAAV